MGNKKPALSSGSKNFQRWASEQGRWWEDTCEKQLCYAGFEIRDRRVEMPECGIEVDLIAENQHGIALYFSCKGSMQGDRPGLMRTDTLKKAIAEMVLLDKVGYGPLFVLASHAPMHGCGVRMLATALGAWPFRVLNPMVESKRLRWLAQAEEAAIRDWMAVEPAT